MISSSSVSNARTSIANLDSSVRPRAQDSSRLERAASNTSSGRMCRHENRPEKVTSLIAQVVETTRPSGASKPSNSTLRSATRHRSSAGRPSPCSGETPRFQAQPGLQEVPLAQAETARTQPDRSFGRAIAAPHHREDKAESNDTKWCPNPSNAVLSGRCTTALQKGQAYPQRSAWTHS